MEKLRARGELLTIIKTVSEENGINNYVITDVKTNEKGEGYLGEIFMVTVKDAVNGKQQQMVIKSAFTDEKVRQMIPVRMTFQNEIFFYENVQNIYKKLEEKNGVLRNVEYIPKCLKVCLKDQQEILVLQDLKNSGFEIFSKKLILDDDHVKLIFKTYGEFHAYSFVLKDQMPEEYAKITKQFHNIYAEFMKATTFGEYIVQTSKLVQDLLIPGEDDKIIKKFKNYSDDKNISDIFTDLVIKDVDYSAILHGDCWSNNMMFKYKNTDSGRKPIDMRLIDFQIIKVGSPVCDLSYCLYSGASKKVFDNLNEYLQIYHNSFSSLVRQLGSDPDKLFPFEVLKDHWQKYSRFGMIMALPILKMKMTPQEDIIDFTDGYEMDELLDVVSKQKFDQEGFSKRMRGLLWHMSELDAL